MPQCTEVICRNVKGGKPYVLVGQGSKQLPAGYYEARVPVKGQDELALNFNPMETVV
tara:strand:+ start:1441 stop:1611 length:171 start_codon:yes stop_codon:yes gene_type:complete